MPVFVREFFWMVDKSKMELCRIILKIFMWVLIAGFGCNFVMQTMCYSFYKSAKQMKEINFIPESNYSDKKIVVMGHSYGTGIAAYRASA